MGMSQEELMKLMAQGGQMAAPQYSTGFKVQQGLQGLMGNRDLALALLANSGSSPQKRGFGEILGTSALQADQMKTGREDDAFKRQYMQAQMAAMGQRQNNRKLISVIGADGKPVLKYEDEAAGMMPYAGGNDAKPSALIQAYDRAREQGFDGSILEFQTQLAKASAQYPYAVGEVGGVPNLIPRTNPTQPSKPQPANFDIPALLRKPLSDLGTEANAKNVLAGAGAAGTTTGTAVATAQLDLSRVEDNATQMLKMIDRLETHPGRKAATGASSAIPIDRLPGTDARDFVTGLKQVGGKQFLEAYNTLKGGGAITETEGTKAETAISTIQDRGQTEEAWLQAADDLRDVVNSGLRRAKRKAGAAEVKSGAPSVGTVKGGYRFKGGNPADKNSWEPVK